ncbi:MAG: stage IV sporulation protein A [Firmicutes bacterium]|nr:stage IV sporulation protein A [Bacillota bacterium]
MENIDVLKDVSRRTGGDIYLGVVGPVRTGKSTFIKRFMESLVLPRISDPAERARATDELPQSGSGRTVMTAEPKFIPAEAVPVEAGEGIELKVRLVDCVGYAVEGAQGFDDENGPRMVDTPWFEQAVSFEEAAAAGTQKVIGEHSTLGVVVLSDGSFGDIPYEAYLPAAQRVVDELHSLEKPFVVVLNSSHPYDDETQALARELSENYSVAVLPLDVPRMDEEDVLDVLNAALYEFPVSEISVGLPRWVEELEPDHWLRTAFESEINAAVAGVERVRDVSGLLERLRGSERAKSVSLKSLDLGSGAAEVALKPEDSLYFRVLSEYAGEPISGEHQLLPLLRRCCRGAREWEKMSAAMEEVAETGYGVVDPRLDEMYLEEPELIKQGGHFGVRLRASAPSYHIIRTSVSTEITPLIGTEKQCEDLVRYITSEFEDDPSKIWQTNIFGKSLHELVSEGISGKLAHMPPQAREKLAQTLQRIVNDKGGGIICIII